MDIVNTPIEETLKYLLQRQITFTINDRVIKKGKLVIFKQNNYCVDLHLNQSQTKKEGLLIYTIPIPFTIIKTSQNILFDYRLVSLVRSNERLLQMVKNIAPARKTKFYDTILNIRMEPL